jgi:hypothetical protein
MWRKNLKCFGGVAGNLLHHLVFSYSLQVHTRCESLELEIRVAGKGMRLVVFQPVQVLVALSTCLAAKGLLLFHPQGSWIRRTCFRVNNRESAITIFVELLSLMTVRLVVPIAVLVDFSYTIVAGSRVKATTYLRPFWFL